MQSKAEEWGNAQRETGNGADVDFPSTTTQAMSQHTGLGLCLVSSRAPFSRAGLGQHCPDEQSPTKPKGKTVGKGDKMAYLGRTWSFRQSSKFGQVRNLGGGEGWHGTRRGTEYRKLPTPLSPSAPS